jgi:aspartate aminotransferase-like enzyme
MAIPKQMLRNYFDKNNDKKYLFTPGPTPVFFEQVKDLKPCFGRGDGEFIQLRENVFSWLKQISGQEKIVAFQGSGSLAIEIAIRNFAFGRVLILDTGYYSKRIYNMVSNLLNSKQIKSVQYLKLHEAINDANSYDWLLSPVTETSNASIIKIDALRALAESKGSKLLLDATASIGLEENHHLADVVTFSSCKGLFALTGAAFVAYSDCELIPQESFYLDLETHSNFGVTGPYHQIQSINGIIPIHNQIKNHVIESKSAALLHFEKYLNFPVNQQPVIATSFNCELVSKKPNQSVMYIPRTTHKGTVISHLGEVANFRRYDKKYIFKILEVV